MVEKAIFLGQIFEMEILMGLHDVTLESENHTFSVWSVCVCHPYNSKTDNGRDPQICYSTCIL